MGMEELVKFWQNQKELKLDDIKKDGLKFNSKEEQKQFRYIWLTPSTYNVSALYNFSGQYYEEDNYCYFFLKRHIFRFQKCYYMESTMGDELDLATEEVCLFKSKKDALAAREEALEYFRKFQEPRPLAPFVIEGDGALNSLLCSKHIELLEACKLYKIKIETKTSWNITEEK